MEKLLLKLIVVDMNISRKQGVSNIEHFKL